MRAGLHVIESDFDPTDPDTIFAGTSPSAVYRSRDGGHQWEKFPLELAEECAIGTPG